MDPITLGLIATSALGRFGEIFGEKKRSELTPDMLKQMFGAKAITDEQMELFKRALNSTQGQQLMTTAAQSGQQFQTDVARRSGEAGLGPSGGASGGADVFAGAASQSAVGNLQNAMKASLMEHMLPVAQGLVGQRMQAWLGDRERFLGQSTKFQDIMGGVAGLGSNLLASRSAAGSPDTTDSGDSNWVNTPNYEGYKDFAPAAAGAPSSAMPTATPAGASAQSPAPAPMGVQPVVGAMPREKQMSMLMQGGGRFARAMSSTNRFGAVQPAFGG